MKLLLCFQILFEICKGEETREVDYVWVDNKVWEVFQV